MVTPTLDTDASQERTTASPSSSEVVKEVLIGEEEERSAPGTRREIPRLFRRRMEEERSRTELLLGG